MRSSAFLLFLFFSLGTSVQQYIHKTYLLRSTCFVFLFFSCLDGALLFSVVLRCMIERSEVMLLLSVRFPGLAGSWTDEEKSCCGGRSLFFFLYIFALLDRGRNGLFFAPPLIYKYLSSRAGCSRSIPLDERDPFICRRM